MTVCVAAICDGGRIIGASDRMLTASDVEFEPPQSKVWHLTASIVAMIAGDASVQGEILKNVHIDVRRQVIYNPHVWWKVRDVAELYRKYYRAASIKRAEDLILKPLGLDSDSFIARQKEMSPDLVLRLARALQDFALPDMAAIFVGVDNDGPIVSSDQEGVYSHIYVANGPEITQHDNIAFAAIGIGQPHAESQFMFAKYTRHLPFPEALFLTYSAKKRAEVAPGVGVDTDMFSIGPALGTHFSIAEQVISELEKIYQAHQKESDEAKRRAADSTTTYVNEITKASEKTQPQSMPSDAQTSEDHK